MQAVRLAILGLGTVGGGALRLLQDNADEIARRTGREIRITQVGSRRARPDLPLDGIAVSDDLMALARHPDVDIVVEVIGGVEKAFEVVMEAISHGKHVVTANKALLAEHGSEIFAAAEARGVQVAFEAAVAGGVPIIKVLREGLSANRIDWLAGIINGTGNFILTEMREKGRAFDEVLREAQALGYAEADPTFDVEGIDAAHKLTLLASIAFGIPLQFDRVYTEGISKLTAQDVQYADELGYTIKHLGIARRHLLEDNRHGIELRVHPTLIPKTALLASVNGVKNAVLVQSNAVGPTLYYGAGAGAGPTASAIVADVVDLVRLMTLQAAVADETAAGSVPHLAFQPDALADTPVLNADQMHTAYYLRLMVNDQPGVLSQVSGILSDAGINIDAILQKPTEGGQVPVIILTQPVQESAMNQALTQIEALPSLIQPVQRIRLERLDA